jgi:hypothetical protein
MRKRQLHHYWTKIRWIKPWYFLVLAVLSGIICIFALRANNQHMIGLREAVYTADKNNTDVQAALKELQSYVTTHMNTNLSTGNTSVYPPIQLKYTYERLSAAQKEQFAKNSDLYTEAQHYCEQQNSSDFSGRNRVPCIEQYVQDHTTQAAPAIPDALYKFAFATPKWSPDLAGWSLVVTLVSLLLFAVTFTFKRLAK